MVIWTAVAISSLIARIDAVWPMTAYGTLVKNQGKLGFMNRNGEYIIQPGNYDAGEMDTINALLVLINKDNGKAGILI